MYIIQSYKTKLCLSHIYEILQAGELQALELYHRSSYVIIAPSVNGDCALVFQSGSSYHILRGKGGKGGMESKRVI